MKNEMSKIKKEKLTEKIEYERDIQESFYYQVNEKIFGKRQQDLRKSIWTRDCGSYK
jgi:hypothetical protein